MYRRVRAPVCGCMIHRNRGSEIHEVCGVKGETHEKFENISQSRRKNWLHPTVAVRYSDSYFDCDISVAWMHVIGAKPLQIKKLAHDHTMLYALESKEHRVYTYKSSEV